MFFMKKDDTNFTNPTIDLREEVLACAKRERALAECMNNLAIEVIRSCRYERIPISGYVLEMNNKLSAIIDATEDTIKRLDILEEAAEGKEQS